MLHLFTPSNKSSSLDNHEAPVINKKKRKQNTDKLSELEKKYTDLEEANRELSHLLMDQMRSNSSLGNIIALFERCSHESAPLSVGAHIQEALACYDFEYCFLVNWPEQHYLFSHDGFITDLQAKIITHLTLQRDRIIRFNNKTLINYPYFAICLTLLDDSKLDDLTRLSQVCDYIIENLAKSSRDKIVKRRLSQKALSDTIELLDNIMDIENTCNNCTMDCFSDFRWTIQSTIIGMDLAPEDEERITYVLEQLLEQFEQRQVSTRTIDKYLRRAKCNLLHLDSEDKLDASEP
ncbi:hypothetical protein O5O45_03520 [Hahella aquimaris]|uniref:hypothetical protein n=1 Tax=Hahella sp. HNIBRBA332 TaxID=3015983 RepID=UPI00273A7D90|nr:hypothetical protein [Hahella sp. HNIBRBA332]WLQ14999.1 hypothetical protein O5O45_03520 [Hahella sp. HNIBRBA332]